MLPGLKEGDPAPVTAPGPRFSGRGAGPGRIRHRIERGHFAAGFLALGVCAAIVLEAGFCQAIENGRLERLRGRGGTAVGWGQPGSDRLVGRIEVPRLRMSAVIREGIDPHTLLIAAGHVPGTSFPGEIGNVVLSAHRDTFFRRLKHILPGDSIRIVTPARTYLYRVEATEVIDPERTEVLAPAETRRLTLITCYPFDFVGPAPKRFIVRARQVGPPDGPPGEA